jgi:hypothetical protein
MKILTLRVMQILIKIKILSYKIQNGDLKEKFLYKL